MVSRVVTWAQRNTGTFHTEGIHALGECVAREFGPLCGEVERIALAPHERFDDEGVLRALPLGVLWRFRQRPEAKRRFLLAVHLDTVFPPEHAFQRVGEVTRDDPMAPGRRVLRGPGVCDAKGGLAVLWTALEAFERFRDDDDTGWTVLLNPDEEIGSPGSAPFLAREAARADLGLVFEPALPDGAVVAARKGSGNFSFVARGRGAHVGRAFSEGRSAIHALGDLSQRVAALNRDAGVVANVGFIRGGGAVNVVADFAIARCNIRVETSAQQHEVEAQLARWCTELEAAHDLQIELQGAFLSPPKTLGRAGVALLESFRDCGDRLGIPIVWRDTGGVCDGNKLAAAGLPNLDTLGPVGGGLHSEDEYLDVDSLVPRAQLVAQWMLDYARGVWTLPDTSAPARRDTP